MLPQSHNYGLVLAGMLAAGSCPIAVQHAPSPAEAVHASDPTPIDSSLWIGDYEVVLNTMTLRMVIDHFHSGTVIDTISGGESASVTCYRTPGPSPAVITLESGDLGGLELSILAFSVASSGEAVPPNCPVLSVDPASIRSSRGLRLGMRREQVIQALKGADVRTVADEVIAIRTAAVPAKDGRPPFDTDSGVRARFLGERVVDLYVWFVAST